jgi:exopolyphosphatase/guanosine-5'-triphosphate,3'-diphosphate pyrophosphatase
MNAGLPGFDPRELLLISLITRYHRKGDPDVSELGALAQDGDDERLRLLCAIIRLAEQLERSRDGAIRNVNVATSNGAVRLAADGDPALDTTVPIWAARQSAGLLAEALDREVEIA